MGVPSITTNLSGFGCFMDESVENPPDYGIYIIDSRTKSVEDSVQQLVDCMMQFCQKSRRQRIIQRNRTERLSDILDWKRMGLEYAKARELALRRRYPQSFESYGSDDEFDNSTNTKVPKPASTPSSPKIKSTFGESGDQLAEQLASELQELAAGEDSKDSPAKEVSK